ncbi:hypothetical protein Pyn_26433 [Prunus yedoensis var. nudiflora]|uniref:Uncharacterized protein n=1 Tax=Prunus yedoensis var. nudiflora TaxID=2094558 RepID=A0A314ZUV5_PRUYE|nr:hypothetical protein Pyn_26433 [Prunus yedoensis var. nudiflora]
MDKFSIAVKLVQVGRFGPTSCFGLIGRVALANKHSLRDRLDPTIRSLLNQIQPRPNPWPNQL